MNTISLFNVHWGKEYKMVEVCSYEDGGGNLRSLFLYGKLHDTVYLHLFFIKLSPK